MHGAKQYAELFRTGQVDRLYLVSGSHARGKTFHIYVLPEGVKAKSNGPNNAPLNCDAVEVYGVTGGRHGWTETYGWLHAGKWQEDFSKMVEARKAILGMENQQRQALSKELADTEHSRKLVLLSTY